MGLRALRSCLGIEAAVSVAEVMASWLLQALLVVCDLISYLLTPIGEEELLAQGPRCGHEPRRASPRWW